MFWNIRHYFSKYGRRTRKINKLYEHPISEECYALNDTIIDWLIPRLKLFIKDSFWIIDWEEHKEKDSIDVVSIVKDIIDDLEYIKEWKWASLEKCEKEVQTGDETKSWKVIQDKMSECSKRAFDNLGKIFFYLWW